VNEPIARDETRDETDRLYAQLRAEIERERGPAAWLRARSTPVRIALVAAVAVGVVALAVAVTGHTAFFVDTTPVWLASVAALAALGGFAIRAALRPIYRPAWSNTTRVVASAAVLLGALGAVVSIGDGSLGALDGGRCVVLGLLAGAPVFSLALLVERVPRRGAFFGALAGAVAGATTAQVLCPAPGLLHLLVGHFGIVASATAVFGAIAAFVARRDRARLGP
jgi:hypothetical protein